MEMEPPIVLLESGAAATRSGRGEIETVFSPAKPRISTDHVDHAAQQKEKKSVGGEAQEPPHRPKRLPFLQDIKLLRSGSQSTPSRPNLSYIKELAMNTRVSTTEEALESPFGGEENPYVLVSRALKTGNLIKTSKSRGNKATPGNSRQRKFRLTDKALEYLHTFSHVKVKRSYPLTAVEKVEYDNTQNPLIFKLVFSTYILSLQAESEEEARDWVEKINKAWSMWVSTGDGSESGEEEMSPPVFETIPEDAEVMSEATPTSENREWEPEADKKRGSFPWKLPPTRTRSFSSSSGFLRRESTQDMELEATYDSRKRRFSRKAFRIARLRPQLERTTRTTVSDPMREHDPAHERLHKEFSMIKYPSKIFRLPTERVFKVDRDNLQILWKKVSRSGYRQKSSLNLRRIVEVRKGQRTPWFDKFPYQQVEDHSFSLLFETETNKYAKLSSLDVICDQKDSFLEWMEGLPTLVSSSQWLSLFPPRYGNSDPTILWLKMIWSCKSENHELKQHDAIKLVKKFIPHTTHEEAKLVVEVAHNYQFKHTFNYGAALRWDGFVLMFHILCNKKDLQLYRIFLDYAKQYPDLGLTVDEFRNFLTEESYWLPKDAKPSILHTLIKHHDEEHHQAIKKFYARNQAKEFQTASKLLSFAGFLSFLRSKDNSVINMEHEQVYQDMTQPLSHYFINSSHNTYLEGDQLTGTSSTDAYVRTLLQGCRCVEIDCWDGVRTEDGLSEKEAVIYHGYTLTTKIAFRDVIHAISDHGFSSSIYPIIISIENHCSPAQQSRMAKVFRAIFADRLPKENLVELEGRDRLPSPEELQGKIILKGSIKKESSRTVDRKAKKVLKKLHTQSQAGFDQLDPGASVPVNTKLRSTSALPPMPSPSASLSPTIVSSLPPNLDYSTHECSSLFPKSLEKSKPPVDVLPKSSSPNSPKRAAPSPPTPTKSNSPKSPMKPRVPLPNFNPESSLPPTNINSLPPTNINSKSSSNPNSPETRIRTESSKFGRSWSSRMRNNRYKLEGMPQDQIDGGHNPFLRINRKSFRRQGLQDRLAQHEQGHDDQELEFTETDEDLKALIVYCRSVSIKPWNWNLQKETTMSEMFSFGEPSAAQLCKQFSRDMLCCTERQLVRTYPKGTRFDSSNYDPFQMWNCGVQMVALNFQHPDIEMHLNQGFFRQNGGCGYVLKPLVMRLEDPGRPGQRGKAPFSPDMKVPHPTVAPVDLEMELLSGQRLCSWKKKCNYVTVDIQSFGIKHDCGKMKQANHSNAFWSSWKAGEHVFMQRVIMPELCLVYIRVENEGKKIYGQNCFPVISLLPGIKFIPLRTNGGELIPESGIFVRIKKVTSDRRIPEERRAARSPKMVSALDDEVSARRATSPSGLLTSWSARQPVCPLPEVEVHPSDTSLCTDKD